MDFKKLEQYFDVNKVIAESEKAALSVFAYVQPKEVSEVLTKLTVANGNFARAQVEGFKTFGAIVAKSVEEAKTSFEKSFATK